MELAITQKNGQNHIVIYDDIFHSLLSKYRWNISQGYVLSVNRKGQPRTMMHRLILNIFDLNIKVDHIDGNKLDNRLSNLRLCTHRQNMKNRKAHGKSKYLGVSVTKKGKYIVCIRTGQKQEYIGCFSIEEDAARAYDSAAKIYHGEFANLNFKTDI